ncbi:MAG: LysM peptidoglycan-binding domain-containing protein [Pirellulaceae bacterium]
MNHGGRIGLLACSVTLLIVGVVCLRNRIGPVHAPPAFVPAEDQRPNGSQAGRASQPTVLTSDPRSDATGLPAGAWPGGGRVPGAESPLPGTYPESSYPGPSYPGPTYPVNSDQMPQPIPYGEGPPPGEVPPGSELRAIPQTFYPAAAGPAVAQVAYTDNRVAAAGDGSDGALSPVMAAAGPELHVPANPASVPTELPDSALWPVMVTTRANDSLWSVSEQAYGVGLYYRALFAWNRDVIPRPDRIDAGVQLMIPSLDDLRQRYPELCPPPARR